MAYRGGTARLYYDATVSWQRNSGIDVPAEPTWTEITKVIDLTLNLEAGESDGNSRESDWTADAGGLKDASVDFGYRAKQGADTDYDNLWNSFVNDVGHLFAIVNGDITEVGTSGLQGVFVVKSATENQPLTDGASVDFSLANYTAYDSSNLRISPVRIVIAAP
jgi:hypothetical protein